MAEILGAKAAGVQMFETVIVILKRASEALKHKKGLIAFLNKHRRELERIRDLSESVRNEKAFKGAKVSEPLTRLKTLEDELCAWLAKVDPRDKRSLRQFADQLIRGPEDRKKLDDIMNDLDRVKRDLILAINMHQTSLSHDIRKAMDTKSKNTIHIGPKPEKNRTIVGKSNFAVRTKPPDKNQQSDSEDDDISTESSEPENTSSEDSDSDESTSTIPQEMVRKTNNNEVGENALMLNAALGEKDLWGHIRVVEIEGNKVKRGALMFNYRNDEKGIALAMDVMNAQRAADREDRKAQREEEREERRAQRAEEIEQMLLMREKGLGMYWVPPSRGEPSSSSDGSQYGMS